MAEFPIIGWSVLCGLLPEFHRTFTTEDEAATFADHLRGVIASEGGDAVVVVSAIVDAPPLHELLGCQPHEVDKVLADSGAWD